MNHDAIVNRKHYITHNLHLACDLQLKLMVVCLKPPPTTTHHRHHRAVMLAGVN